MSIKSLEARRLMNMLIALGFLALIGVIIYIIKRGGVHEWQERRYTRQIIQSYQERHRKTGNEVIYDVTPLVDQEYFHLLMGDMAKARRRIDVLLYELKLGSSPDNAANQLVEELIRAKKRGVDVRVRLETARQGESLTKIHTKTARYLKDHGIFPSFDRPDAEMHGKAVLIDGRILYTGNHNWSESALRRNKEVSFRIETEQPLSVMKIFFDEFDGRRSQEQLLE